ncbi:MAG: carbohydrate-binding protein [Eubacteriales bacterium]
MSFSMKILNSGKTIATSSPCGQGISLVHTTKYQEKDVILLEVGGEYGFYWVKLDEAMAETLVYVSKREEGGILRFPIPFDKDAVCYPPKAFVGDLHVLTARKATEAEINGRKNLSMNPYDHHQNDCFYPHSKANVETRNEAVFASRNAIDGVFNNDSHGKYPYSSWGVNRDPEAALTLEFGREVVVDEVKITLRADFPHDNFWVQGEISFSDGSTEILKFVKSALPQSFPMKPRVVTNLVLFKLIKSDDPSPFPALTQIEVYGTEKLS